MGLQDSLKRIDRLANMWWSGHLVMLVLAAGMIGAAVLITPSDAMLSLWGIDIPIVCSFRKFFGIPCPGCGMTRSFVFFAHGHPLQAFQMNVFGPFLFVGMGTQIPYRIYRLWQGEPPRRSNRAAA